MKVFKKPSIEYWNTIKSLDYETAPDMLKLNVKANNPVELEKLINLAIDEPAHEVWNGQKNAFDLNFKKFGENATQHCINVVLKLIENK